MNISKKWVALLALLVVLGSIAIIRLLDNEDSWTCVNGLWEKHGNPNKPAPTTGCGNTNETQINFEKLGYISNREASLPNEGMYLVYEEPGKPALSTKLKFDEKSTCIFGKEKMACISLNSTIEKATENKKVFVNGFEYGGIVLVKNLITE
jgi:hypothetical protein